MLKAIKNLLICIQSFRRLRTLLFRRNGHTMSSFESAFFNFLCSLLTVQLDNSYTPEPVLSEVENGPINNGRRNWVKGEILQRLRRASYRFLNSQPEIRTCLPMKDKTSHPSVPLVYRYAEIFLNTKQFYKRHHPSSPNLVLNCYQVFVLPGTFPFPKRNGFRLNCCGSKHFRWSS